jgi:dTMP kinase
MPYVSHHKGLLIAFDGLDSTGKETQSNKLIDRLRFSGHQTTGLRSPDYSTPSGQELKLRLQNKVGDWAATPWQDKMKYFAANRAEHKDQVNSVLNADQIVVYDRYVPSSVAFMIVEALPAQEVELFREEIAQAVEREEYLANHMPKEDISIFLDIPPEVSAALLEKRKHGQKEDDEYTDHFHIQQRLYNEYDFLCRTQPHRFMRIKCTDGTELLGVEDIAELVWESLLVKFPSLNNLKS